MSGPDQVQDAEPADAGYDNKDYQQPQQQNSRLRISSLLCTIEAAEPVKTAPWESPRTEAVHLESYAHQQQHHRSSSSSQSPSQPWRAGPDGPRSDQDHKKPLEARQNQTHPIPSSSLRSTAGRSSSMSNPSIPYDTPHYANSRDSFSSQQKHPTYASTAAVAGPRDLRRPADLSDRTESNLGRRELEARNAGYSPHSHPYPSSSLDPITRNTPGGEEHRSPFSTSPSASLATKNFTPRPTSWTKRSASMQVESFQPESHPYDEDLRRPRTERSKSDYALHQQNYGPYLDAHGNLLYRVQATITTINTSSSNNSSSSIPTTTATAVMASTTLHPSITTTNTSSSLTAPIRRDHNPNSTRTLAHRLTLTIMSHCPLLHPQPTTTDPYTHHLKAHDDLSKPSLDAQAKEFFSRHLSSVEPRKPPTRIYGLDAADAPARPPLAPSASYGSTPLHDIPDEGESEYPRASTMQQPQYADVGYRQAREPAARYHPYVYERRSSSTSVASNYNTTEGEIRSRYRESPSSGASAGIDRPAYNSGNSGNGYRIPSPPNTSSSSPLRYRRESRPYSPSQDIQPPSWYQQYAHAVPSKPQSSHQQTQSSQHHRSSFSRSDLQSYGSVSAPASRRGSEYGVMRSVQESQQQAPSPDLRDSRSSFSAEPSVMTPSGPAPVAGVAAKSSRLSTSHSVHPFDIPASGPIIAIDAPAQPLPPSKLAGTKRERERDDDPFVTNSASNSAGGAFCEDGVKAKRKRANTEQLSILNSAFERSYFPSTEERLRLSKQTKMCPRTVQIWFQNKRQSVKARTEAMDAAVAAVSGGSTAGASGSGGAGRRRGSQAQSQGQGQTGAEFERKGTSTVSSKRSSDEMEGVHPLHPPRRHGSMSSYGQHQYHQQQQHQQTQRRSPLGLGVATSVSHEGEKRRSSGPSTPSDAVMETLHVQLDGRSVDYFSRKRRATVAQMEQSEH
ncbi:hypothetical protein BGZ99_008396 [Dissophora globulifera]|uniref:Homeobox domain-containing protein n=1 Tax=Dissophora globulifera TaxID=979702 RepID=A0A9P6R7F1_9FUNG|nr:hypothetical protein BGZ99_008396 [Dissophora globulifera]